MHILIFPSKFWAKKCTLYTAKYGIVVIFYVKKYRCYCSIVFLSNTSIYSFINLLLQVDLKFILLNMDIF